MDKELLYKRKASNRTTAVELDGGEVVLVVRGLTRGEVAELREDDPAEDVYERRLIAAALVDPKMSYEEVTRWFCGDPDDPGDEGAPAGDSVTIMQAVADLSGISEGARKSNVSKVRGKRRR